ncbi:MAG: R3H domain-containing nucleic acid-binding protein [Actinomycetota bacterium]|nr:R3H domain-containing nucleic acid-binding protein [Actinomycetota bacterium]
MTEENSIGNALDSYVESLEEEQKNNKLLEDSTKGERKEKEIDKNIGGLEKIKGILKKSIELICIGEKVKISTDLKKFKLLVDGKDLGIAIGRGGKNIQALEYIINLIGKRKNIIDKNVFIDIKNYRKNKMENIKKDAIRMARKAIKEGRKIYMKPMCGYERKTIHKAISRIKDVGTKSVNEEPVRRVIIYPEKAGK